MIKQQFKNKRYNRQECMPEWGPEKQKILKKAKVAVIGAGGVKSTLLLSLVSGGIGNIRIIDFDRVELSNLNRQILYKTSDIGKYKAIVSKNSLINLNPEINIEGINEKLTSENIDKLLDGFEIVVEGGESPSGRNLINEWCLKNCKPYVHASAQYSYGYLFSVIPSKKTSCFACFFPNDHTRAIHTGPVPVNVLSTSIAGTLGAAEVFKWFLGYKNKMIYNKKLSFSSLLMSEQFSYIIQPRNNNCPICKKYY